MDQFIENLLVSAMEKILSDAEKDFPYRDVERIIDAEFCELEEETPIPATWNDICGDNCSSLNDDELQAELLTLLEEGGLLDEDEQVNLEFLYPLSTSPSVHEPPQDQKSDWFRSSFQAFLAGSVAAVILLMFFTASIGIFIHLYQRNSYHTFRKAPYKNEPVKNARVRQPERSGKNSLSPKKSDFYSPSVYCTESKVIQKDNILVGGDPRDPVPCEWLVPMPQFSGLPSEEADKIKLDLKKFVRLYCKGNISFFDYKKDRRVPIKRLIEKHYDRKHYFKYKNLNVGEKCLLDNMLLRAYLQDVYVQGVNAVLERTPLRSKPRQDFTYAYKRLKTRMKMACTEVTDRFTGKFKVRMEVADVLPGTNWNIPFQKNDWKKSGKNIMRYCFGVLAVSKGRKNVPYIFKVYRLTQDGYTVIAEKRLYIGRNGSKGVKVFSLTRKILGLPPCVEGYEFVAPVTLSIRRGFEIVDMSISKPICMEKEPKQRSLESSMKYCRDQSARIEKEVRLPSQLEIATAYHQKSIFFSKSLSTYCEIALHDNGRNLCVFIHAKQNTTKYKYAALYKLYVNFIYRRGNQVPTVSRCVYSP